MPTIKNVPTNIITGALGVGKSTLIQTLLADKPSDERWAVLVNEFGEVGIDGALLSSAKSHDVFIREVPGGCMCCTSGIPMQIALNMLLATAKPHRLLIEPTGLGHPKEVLQTLTAEHYRGVLDVRATLTLIDIRKLADTRWRAHATFQEQLDIAEQVIVTKSDLYAEDLTPTLAAYLAELGINNIPVTVAKNGKIDLALLTAKSSFKRQKNHPTHAHFLSPTKNPTLVAPATGSTKVENSAEGYYSCGWICAPTEIYNYRAVMDTLTSLSVERLKAVIITDQGVVSYNITDSVLQVVELDEAFDSRIEFISQDQAVAEQICALFAIKFGLVNN